VAWYYAILWVLGGFLKTYSLIGILGGGRLFLGNYYFYLDLLLGIWLGT